MKTKPISALKIFLTTSIIIFFLIFTIYVLNLVQGNQITSQGKFIETSILRINSIPKDVDVFINEQKQSLKENRIEGIRPGEISIKVSKPGYSTWKKILNIAPNVVKDIYIRLIPNKPQLEQITTSNIDKIAYASDTKYIYYSIVNPKDKSEAGLYKQRIIRNFIDFGDIKPQKIADYSELLDKILMGNDYTLKISDDNNKILLNIPSSKLLFAYDTNNTNERIDIIKSLGFYPEIIHWYYGSTSIIIKDKGLLAEYTLDKNELTVINYNPKASPVFAVTGNKVYFIRKNKNVIYTYINKSANILKLPQKIQLKGHIDDILTVKGNPNILLVNTSVGFMFIDIKKEVIKKIDKDISVKAISRSGKTIIYQKGNKLFSYILEESQGQIPYTATKNTINFPIKSIIKLELPNEGTTISLLKENNYKLKTLEFRDVDGHNPEVILKDLDVYGEKIVFSKDSKNIYLLLNDSSLEIHEKENLSKKFKNIYKITLETK